MNWFEKHRSTARRSLFRSKHLKNSHPALETLEDRVVPIAAQPSAGFIQGTAFVDLNQNGILDIGEPALPGATVSLYQGQGTANFLQSQITDANGMYAFTGLTAGAYTIQEAPPAGYFATGVQINSNVDSGTQIDNRTIQAQVISPTVSNPLEVNVNDFVTPAPTASFYVDAVTSGPYQNPALGTVANPATLEAGQIILGLSGGGLPPSTSQFYALGVDVFNDLQQGSKYPVNPTQATVGLQNGGEIAYLYNHYNTPFGSPLSEIQGTGLQLAIWELEYGSAFHLVAVTDGTTDLTTQVSNAASAYVADATGQMEAGDFLVGNGPGANINTSQGRSLIVSREFNFGNDIASKANPSISTVASPGGAVGSTSLTDTATLSGGDGPAGTITFTLTGPGGTVVTTETANVSGDGAYSTPTALAATQVGTYTWSAIYNGDANNNTATDNGQNESTLISQANPSISTVASAGGAVGSTNLTDTATLAGGDSPTGTITFTLTGPGGTVVTTETANVSGDGAYSTPTAVAATQAGTYTWSATYNGDANNNTAIDNGQNESTLISQASPSISTVASAGGAVGTTNLTDTATLTGGVNPTGTITFTLTGPGGSVVTSETANVSGDGAYSTPTAVAATQVGTYTWSSTYNGDANNNAATDNRQNESTLISQANPSISTVASAGGAVGSTNLTDTATLSGGNNPTGTITFTLTGPGGSVVTTETANVNGDGAYSTPTAVAATQVGTYTWSATYNGDANNNTTTDNGQNESTLISKSNPTIATVASAGGAVGSTNLTDTATLAGGDSPTGTITFTLTGPGGKVVTTETANVSGDGSYSTPTAIAATQVGTYTWSATYNGDANNSSATDNGVNEATFIRRTSPSIITVATPSSGVAGGTTLTDTATLSGGVSPTGTITFTLTGPSNNVVATENVTVSGNGNYVSPTPVPATQVGTYTWSATYNGDANNSTATDNGQNESTAITKANPSLSTVASPGGAVGSTSLSDTATLAGGDSPAGTITFTLTGPGGTVVATETVTAAGDGTYTTPSPVTATQVGTYTWSASYSGDSLNNGAHDNGQNETAVISKAGPSITTTATITAGGVVGSAQTKDSATLSGGDNPSGTITFTLKAPDGTTSTVATINVNGDGTYNAPAVNVTEVGTYTWHAVYNGDGLNNTAADNGANESVTSFKASPTIATQASISSSQTSDTATLSGGDNPTGTITFTLKAPDGTTSTVATITANGDGTYNAPSVTVTQSGTYTWHAVYNGDGLNSTAADNGTNESVTNSAGTPLGKGMAATMGFWHNKNGQAVINNFNGGSSATQLGNWMASNFPNLFGGFVGYTNAKVASAFLTAFGNVGGVQGNTYAQLFANALAIYTTTLSLGGASTQSNPATNKFGFVITAAGTGAATYNVGNNGAAFGVPNNTSLTVLQILQIANANYSPSTHLFYGGDSTKTGDLNNVANGINQSGDITQVADNSSTAADNLNLLNSFSDLNTGTLMVYVDNSNGEVTPDEMARIDDAIASIDASLGSFGVNLVDITSTDTVEGADANIVIQVNDTTGLGGVNEGILGVYELGGMITLVNGWNWYTGSDPSQIGADQYDFQTTATHELGHALGLGGSTDTNSPMFESLPPGVARRALTANDLNDILDLEEGQVDPERAAPRQERVSDRELPVQGSKSSIGLQAEVAVQLATIGGQIDRAQTPRPGAIGYTIVATVPLPEQASAIVGSKAVARDLFFQEMSGNDSLPALTSWASPVSNAGAAPLLGAFGKNRATMADSGLSRHSVNGNAALNVDVAPNNQNVASTDPSSDAAGLDDDARDRDWLFLTALVGIGIGNVGVLTRKKEHDEAGATTSVALRD
jgi:hypothetical protein